MSNLNIFFVENVEGCVVVGRYLNSGVCWSVYTPLKNFCERL